jgi:putative peptidoglycan lipid II flippase
MPTGAFNAHSTLMTNYALVFYAVGLWAFSGIRVMVSGFYALQDTKTPVKVAVVAVVVNLVLSLSLAFMTPLKHGGLALALSLASSIQFCLLVFFLKKKVYIGNLRPVLISALKCTFAAVVMGLVVYYSHARWLKVDSGSGLWGMIASLAGLIAVGMIIYFAMARILGCRELASIKEMFRPILRKIGIGHN